MNETRNREPKADLINRSAQGLGEARVSQWGRIGTESDDFLVHLPVYVVSCGTHLTQGDGKSSNFACEPTNTAHFFDFVGSLGHNSFDLGCRRASHITWPRDFLRHYEGGRHSSQLDKHA